MYVYLKKIQEIALSVFLCCDLFICPSKCVQSGHFGTSQSNSPFDLSLFTRHHSYWARKISFTVWKFSRALAHSSGFLQSITVTFVTLRSISKQYVRLSATKRQAIKFEAFTMSEKWSELSGYCVVFCLLSFLSFKILFQNLSFMSDGIYKTTRQPTIETRLFMIN